MERQLHQAQANKSHVEEENSQLHVAIEQLKKDLSTEQTRYAELDQATQKNAAERVALKQKARIFDERLKTLSDNLELRKLNTNQLEDELSKLRSQLKLEEEKRIKAEDERNHMSDLDAENTNLRQHNYLLLDDINTLKRQVAELDGHLTAANANHYEVRNNYEQLKGKLGVLKDLQKTLRDPMLDPNHVPPPQALGNTHRASSRNNTGHVSAYTAAHLPSREDHARSNNYDRSSSKNNSPKRSPASQKHSNSGRLNYAKEPEWSSEQESLYGDDSLEMPSDFPESDVSDSDAQYPLMSYLAQH